MNELTPVLLIGALWIALTTLWALLLRAIDSPIHIQRSGEPEIRWGFWRRTYSFHPGKTILLLDTIGLAACCTPLAFVWYETLLHGFDALVIGFGIASIVWTYQMTRPLYGGRTLEERKNRLHLQEELCEPFNRRLETFFMITMDWSRFIARYPVSEQMSFLENLVDAVRPTTKGLEFVTGILQKNGVTPDYRNAFSSHLAERTDIIGEQARRQLAGDV